VRLCACMVLHTLVVCRVEMYNHILLLYTVYNMIIQNIHIFHYTYAHKEINRGIEEELLFVLTLEDSAVATTPHPITYMASARTTSMHCDVEYKFCLRRLFYTIAF